jgi:hypothetical protein
LIPLGLLYLSLTRRGGPMHPTWGHLSHPLSLRAWATQLSWADPISIAGRSVLPFGAAGTRGAGLLAPAAWLAAALGLAVAVSLPTWSRAGAERRGWAVLAGLLIVGGLAGPDTLGPSHGQYLQQRIVLLGLVALVPALELDPRRWAIRVSVMALIVALVVQSLVVWDYALTAHHAAAPFWNARSRVGSGKRVASLLVAHPGRFRANPLLHADCLLGIDTGNIIWSNYETRFYYFPVQFLAGLNRPDALELEQISLQDDPRDADARARRWERLLQEHHAAIDVLVVSGRDPRLDAVTARWFLPVAQQGPLRILRHR